MTAAATLGKGLARLGVDERLASQRCQGDPHPKALREFADKADPRPPTAR